MAEVAETGCSHQPDTPGADYCDVHGSRARPETRLLLQMLAACSSFSGSVSRRNTTPTQILQNDL